MRLLTLTAFFFLLTFNIYSQVDQEKLVIRKISDRFYTYTTVNTYQGILYGGNGAYIISDEGVFLIDSPWDTTQIKPLMDSIWVKHQKKVIGCLATHSHDDRAGGFPLMHKMNIKTYASAETNRICAEKGISESKYTFQKDTIFKLSQTIIHARFMGAGHTVDNLIVWIPSEKILYGGCLVKSGDATGMGYIGEADLEQWPKTIEKLLKKYKKAKYVIPGHGFEGWEGLASLRRTIELLEENKSKN